MNSEILITLISVKTLMKFMNLMKLITHTNPMKLKSARENVDVKKLFFMLDIVQAGRSSSQGLRS